MICPQCRQEVEYVPGESEICPFCGAELTGKMPAAAPPVTPPPEPASPSRPAVDFQALAASVFAASEEPADLDLGGPEIFPGAVASDCPWLQVEYDRNLFFLSGAQGILKLKLTPLSGELRDLLIFMGVYQGANCVRKQIPFQRILTVGRSMELAIPHQAGELSGELSFEFRIGCKTLSDTKFYQFSLNFSVFDPEASGSAVGDIIINQNQQIQAGNAGDVSYRDNLGDALKELTKRTAPSAYELLNKLKSMPAAYTPVSLAETRWTPEQSFVQGELYQTEKLLVECGGYRFYLIGKPAVKLGRDEKQADLLVRAAGVGPRDYPNNTVSRLHAEIFYCEDSVKLFDRSSYGTYIDGRKPTDLGMPIPDSSEIEFGDIHWRMQIQHCPGKSGHYLCQTCPAKYVRSLTFTRRDGVHEYYLLVWECCELGMIDADMAGWTVFVKNGAFLLRTPEDKIVALNPGRDVVCRDQKLHVSYFQQN